MVRVRMKVGEGGEGEDEGIIIVNCNPQMYQHEN